MMLGTEQIKQGINHRKILDFRFQTRAQEVQMETERNCETVTGWCINTSMMIRSETAPGNQSFEEEKISSSQTRMAM